MQVEWQRALHPGEHVDMGPLEMTTELGIFVFCVNPKSTFPRALIRLKYDK